VVQAGTAVSWRVRPGVPNSVNVVRWERGQGDRQGDGPGEVGRAAGRITVEQWDHSAASGAFEPRAVKRLVPEADLRPVVR
jgi:hypothetical protein